MTVKKFLRMLGENMICSFCIHWNYEEGGEDTEKTVETDSIEAVEELFGNWEIAEEDSIYLTPRKDTEDEVTVDLYVHRATINVLDFIDENPIECPCCGAEHERETEDETEHCCFYCGHSWKDEEEKGENESE